MAYQFLQSLDLLQGRQSALCGVGQNRVKNRSAVTDSQVLQEVNWNHIKLLNNN